MIELIPPVRAGREVIVGHPQQCGRCKGNGWLWRRTPGDLVKTECPDCGGTGEVRAIITIDWEAAGK